MFDRDHDVLSDARERMNVMPLGSGAIAGSTILLDRELVARETRLPRRHAKQHGRRERPRLRRELFVALALIGMHLAAQRGPDFLRPRSSNSSPSATPTRPGSLMPQKKNPDVTELTRGKTGRLVGNLVSLLTTLKGLPMTYNRDMQEDKEALFDSVDQSKLILEVYTGMIPEIEVNSERTREAANDPGLLATDLADYLVLHGLPFRQAHEVIGKLVAYSIEQRRGFAALKLEEFRRFSEHFGPDLFAVLDLDRALRPPNHDWRTFTKKCCSGFGSVERNPR